MAYLSERGMGLRGMGPGESQFNCRPLSTIKGQELPSWHGRQCPAMPGEVWGLDRYPWRAGALRAHTLRQLQVRGPRGDDRHRARRVAAWLGNRTAACNPNYKRVSYYE